MNESPGNPKTEGAFFVIEGTDGSGKGTQSKLFVERLKNEGYEVELFDFPRYGESSSYFVKEYLNGNYGTAEEVGPYTGSLFFSLDRYQASSAIRAALESGKIVIANRFTGSNMAHQGTKFASPEERRGFFIWLDNLEFQMLGIPRPDKSFVLRVPAKVAQKLVDNKDKREYTDKKRDIHEADLEHLTKSVDVYDDLCQLFPKDFSRIDCVRNNQLLSIEKVHDILWKTVEPLLPTKSKKLSKLSVSNPTTVAPTNEFVTKSGKKWVLSEKGLDFLIEAVTDVKGNVYAFTDKLSPITIAAAMARLSRRADDMRITILDEFASHMGKDEKLLQRVITAYGDDSVQQLVGQHIVVEGASNLLTKQLEWGRLASYLEQSTRYIYFDEKDENGKYRYFTPSNLKPTDKKVYEASLNKIFDSYSEMVHDLTKYLASNSQTPKKEQDVAWRAAIRAQACDAIRPVLPVATKSTVGIYASGQALESMIMRLRSSESLEARKTGQKILDEARKIIPTFLERADKPDRGGANTAFMANTRSAVKKISLDLPNKHSSDTAAVKLLNFWPRNELSLLPHMLFEHSNLSIPEIEAEIDMWSIDKKEQAFNTYTGDRLNRRHKPGRAVEQAHYCWELICDYGIFRDLQRHRIVDDLEWQALTPRYGYEVPELVDKAGLADKFEACFDESAKLYSYLQSKGYDYESQYSTLLGHKMRWTVTYNAREAFHLHELRTSPQGHPGYRKLVQEMHGKLCEVHPMLGAAMKFVNQGEDPELTRLAAEKATQYKLEKLDK